MMLYSKEQISSIHYKKKHIWRLIISLPKDSNLVAEFMLRLNILVVALVAYGLQEMVFGDQMQGSRQIKDYASATKKLQQPNIISRQKHVSFSNKETFVAKYHQSQKSIVLRQRSIIALITITMNSQLSPRTYSKLLIPPLLNVLHS